MFEHPYEGARNQVLNLSPGNWVSYNPDTSDNPLNDFADMIGAFFGNSENGRGGGAETALAFKGSCWILAGDHREKIAAEYARDGELGVLCYFRDNHGDGHAYSTASTNELSEVISTL